MARIILKSRYLRAGSKQHSEHLIQYIAKREGVQKIDDTWKHQPATLEQQKLAEELARDFPDTKSACTKFLRPATTLNVFSPKQFSPGKERK
mgnify:CR=1 FL=1